MLKFKDESLRRVWKNSLRISLNFFWPVSHYLYLGKKGERGIVGEAVHRGYLDRHPYREYEKDDLEYAA